MYLVTGGAGYIGSHFIKYFLEKNPSAEIVTVDNLSEGYREAVSHSPRIHFAEANIGDTNAIAQVLKKYKIQTVIHFGASCYVGESQEKPEKYFENNVVNTLNLLSSMENCGVRQMVFSSTCATYGHPHYMPMDEQHPQAPINVYGSTKLMVEQALHAYSLAKGWSYVALRYFNAAGADESGLIGECHNPETHLIPLTLQVASGQRKNISVFGTDYDTPDGTCIRDYIHVNDLADAHLRAIEYVQAHPGGQAFNLGTTHGSSVLEVINTCREVTGHEIPVVYGPRRDGDPARLVANADKAEKLLGWKTKYDLKRIVETAWQWEQHKQFGKPKSAVH